MPRIANSPASSGPAGAHFEGQVGAHYLLTMLAGAEPRGLPGTTIDRVALQRSGENFPLDDVIVHAHDRRGEVAVLEIQVKRSISFSPSDTVFAKVVEQIVVASRKSEFGSSRYELAIATANSSRMIDRSYQEVLTWARQLGDSTTFFERLERKGSANDGMRSFVGTFKSNLQKIGAPDDNETVWKLLSRLHILIFDFITEGSASTHLANERAIRVLHENDAHHASKLWASLIELSIHVAGSGGERNRSNLINELIDQAFRFAGERRFAVARAAIDEASRNALADIDNSVGDYSLNRNRYVSSILKSLTHGRYIEIRGDSGVGKSGVLKHLAKQTGEEANPLVFSPNRTVPNGWSALRSEIGFDGSAKELLTDYAADGSATIFIDGLDFFRDQERLTVIDLVREAARTPGITVVATVRRDFGKDEPNWLPRNALSALGVAPPVIVGELTEEETAELSYSVPSLAPLLSNNHPARNVTRNLFRLARLARQPENAPLPNTEVDMANQWWETADGNRDNGHRDRSRVLRYLATQVIDKTEAVDVSNQPPSAIDALVTSETLRDLGNDNVLFRHDVLREWAIACLINTDKSVLQQLPLQHPAPPGLARAMELYSRSMLENDTDSTRWQALLESMSADNIHGSWRRMIVLSVVRSEIANTLLTRVSTLLFADDGKLLCEIIRLLIAIDVQPAAQILSSAGMETSMIPKNLNMPSGPSWWRLILWIKSIEETLPLATIPDVVNLYTNWSLGTLGQDALTPMLIQSLYKWLTEIEDTREEKAARDIRYAFSDVLEYDQIVALESDLRTGFLMFCNSTPDLAVKYLQELKVRQHNREAVSSILKFRGSLAQAAPAELADMTLTALILRDDSEGSSIKREHRDPFEYVDHQFLPASPAQGPFLELLTQSPKHGMVLIQKLVEHAICFYSSGRQHTDDTVRIVFPDGERCFPFIRTYHWSREGTGHNCMTSGLMALEGWAHRRIDAGEPFDHVLSDIIGPPGSSCAFLLVAVDLILSHWPVSRQSAIPFVASPELLCIDRERAVHDGIDYPDFFGLKTLHREPAGSINLEGLKGRRSRGQMLDQLLDNYAVFEPYEQREILKNTLETERIRLGPPDESSTLRDPRFMAVHALNRINPENYLKVSISLKDGTRREGFQYESPDEEKQHLSRLHDATESCFRDTDMQLMLSSAVDDSSRSSSEYAAAAVDWAQKTGEEFKLEGSDDLSLREDALVTAAMIAMRDGDTDLREKSADWARQIFIETFNADEDPAHRFRKGVRFNPSAIAFVGMVHALKHDIQNIKLHDILSAVSNGNPAVAHGLCATAKILYEIDERLITAILRIAFTTCVRSARRHWNMSDDDNEQCKTNLRQRAAASVNAELAWLSSEQSEPNWPDIPAHTIGRHRGIRFTREQSGGHDSKQPAQHQKEFFDHQAAALWLSSLHNISVFGKNTWVQSIAHNYSSWTASANGAGLNPDEQLTNELSEWNEAFYYVVALSLRDMSLTEIDTHALTPICSLPDESYFDVLSSFLPNVDEIFFNGHGFDAASAVHIRSKLAGRLTETNGWRRICGSRKTSVEIHIAPAIASLLFNQHLFSQPPRCYLLAKGVDLLEPFLDTIEHLATNGSSLFVALATLNLLEVSPRGIHLPYIIRIAMSWIDNLSDFNAFWVEQGIGRRFCELVEKGITHDVDALEHLIPCHAELNHVLTGLISLGVPEARRLEESLAIDN